MEHFWKFPSENLLYEKFVTSFSYFPYYQHFKKIFLPKSL